MSGRMADWSRHYWPGANGKVCFWCQGPLTRKKGFPNTRTRDHVWPESKAWLAPNHLYSKIVFACMICNKIKGDLLPLEWFHFMFGNIQWRDGTTGRKQRARAFRIAKQQAACCLTLSIQETS